MHMSGHTGINEIIGFHRPVYPRGRPFTLDKVTVDIGYCYLLLHNAARNRPQLAVPHVVHVTEHGGTCMEGGGATAHGGWAAQGCHMGACWPLGSKRLQVENGSMHKPGISGT